VAFRAFCVPVMWTGKPGRFRPCGTTVAPFPSSVMLSSPAVAGEAKHLSDAFQAGRAKTLRDLIAAS
jgi:hypothetical protein